MISLVAGVTPHLVSCCGEASGRITFLLSPALSFLSQSAPPCGNLTGRSKVCLCDADLPMTSLVNLILRYIVG